LIKNSTTRKILFSSYFEFAAPEFIQEEILKHKEEIREKSNISNEEFDFLMNVSLEKVTLVPLEAYSSLVGALKKEVSDVKDIPYLACCKAIKAEGIWSHDPHMKQQIKIKIFTNIDMLNMSK